MDRKYTSKMLRNPEPTAQAKSEDKHCHVYGCQRTGTIHSGHWNCRYHYGQVGGKLAGITTALRQYEPEVNWYEVLLTHNSVDWECGDLKKRAPIGMESLPVEFFYDYRRRIEAKVNALLSVKVVHQAIDRKKMASGDNNEQFGNIGDFMPEY